MAGVVSETIRSEGDGRVGETGSAVRQSSRQAAGGCGRVGDGRKHVVIYTDGGAKPNPGRGGYGAVLIHGNHRRELSGGYLRTTNNRMEILAAIRALEALKVPCVVSLHTDSQYVAKAMSLGWVKRWQRNNWMRNRDERAKNADLWARLVALCARHEVTFAWVRGHAGHPENDRCDALAAKARRAADLPVDPGFPG